MLSCTRLTCASSHSSAASCSELSCSSSLRGSCDRCTIARSCAAVGGAAGGAAAAAARVAANASGAKGAEPTLAVAAPLAVAAAGMIPWVIARIASTARSVAIRVPAGEPSASYKGSGARCRSRPLWYSRRRSS